MGFAEKFVSSINSSNLMEVAFHHDLDALTAAAAAADIGSLLFRVKYVDGTINNFFEGNSVEMASAYFGSNFKIKDCKTVPYDAVGNKIFSPSRSGEIADFDEDLVQLVQACPFKGY